GPDQRPSPVRVRRGIDQPASRRREHALRRRLGPLPQELDQCRSPRRALHSGARRGRLVRQLLTDRTATNQETAMIPRRRFATPLALVLALAAPAARGGDIVVDFNDLGYPNGSYDPNNSFPSGPAPGTGSYDNGWDLNGGFTSGGAFFSNSYDTTFHSWSGWAYSDVNDPTTTGPTPFSNNYEHQFAPLTGPAPGGSGKYDIHAGPGPTHN